MWRTEHAQLCAKHCDFRVFEGMKKKKEKKSYYIIIRKAKIKVNHNFQNTNQLSPAIESKALRYLETGYQQELTYRHADGSFSAFGKSDPSGSTWLVLIHAFHIID